MAKTIQILETTDYKIFKNIAGNREIDEQHVKQLIKSLTNRGNLTGQFPIVVNERMEVIDGQHRLAALMTLEWPVGYRIEEGLTIDTVRHINAAQKNWGWKDYADSYAKLGNDNYQRLLDLYEKYGQGYHVLSAYGGFSGNNDKANSGNRIDFVSGQLNFTFEDKQRADELLAKATDLAELMKEHGLRVGYQMMYQALLVIMKSPEYDHERMVHKVRKYGNRIKTFSSMADQLRSLEDVYNYNIKDGSAPVRLF